MPDMNLDLLSIIGKVDMQFYCAQGGLYREWEQKVAKPALESLGFTEVKFYTSEHDDFGPLMRNVVMRRDNKTISAYYG